MTGGTTIDTLYKIERTHLVLLFTKERVKNFKFYYLDSLLVVPKAKCEEFVEADSNNADNFRSDQ